METLKYLEYCTHLAFLTIYQGRGRDFKSSYKCVRQTFGSELLCRHRLSLSKQPASPSVSPPCGNLLLLYKERRGQRGGPGEVCATDSGAGRAGQWAVLSPFTNQCQTTAPGLLPAAGSSHTHTSHIHGVDTLFTHSPGSPLMVTMGSHSPVENTDCIWHTHYRWLFTHLRRQWQLRFQMGVKWTEIRTPCCGSPRLDFSWASIIHTCCDKEVIQFHM